MSVQVSFNGPRADLVLARPDRLNAMNVELFDELAASVDEITGRPEMRVVVVSGEGRAFSSGLDTSSFGESQGSPAEMIARAQAGFRKLGTVPIPTIAKVHGYAFGAGLQLALMCDVRVVASGTKLGILEANYGLVPDLGGTHRLPALVGPGVAKKMIWLAEKIDADEAHRIGLAEIVCPPDQLGAVTDDLAIRLAAAPPIPVRAAKSLVDGALRRSLDEHMDAEALAQQKVFASADFLEAMTAFMQKREPSYTGA